MTSNIIGDHTEWQRQELCMRNGTMYNMDKFEAVGEVIHNLMSESVKNISSKTKKSEFT